MLLTGAALASILAACGSAGSGDTSPSLSPTTTTTSAAPEGSVTPTPTPSGLPTASPFDAAAVIASIQHLTGIGPREATSHGFDQAADWVGQQFAGHGYTVTEQQVDVPAGTSWGVPVEAGSSRNVIADPPGFDPAQPHLVIGAHLDTVPQSPGAEDNASGVAVMLELARMVAEEPAARPVRFIAFGAEEPRGPGDERHHYGSRHYVAELDHSHRAAIVAMVSLDRVGVPGEAVPVGTGGTGTTAVAEQLVAAAGVIPTALDSANRTSDHWSFEKAGIPAARLGSIPYEGYHSPADSVEVVDPGQLASVGAIVWAWLRGQPA